MHTLFPELALVLALLFLQAGIAAARQALSSARKNRLREQADAGDDRAARALVLVEDRERLLPAARGLSLLTAVAIGAVGGAGLAPKLAALAPDTPWTTPVATAATALALGLLCFILGSAAPRRATLRNPEAAVAYLAPHLARLASPLRPLARLADRAVATTLTPFDGPRPTETPVDDGEINDLVQQGLKTGAFNPTETEMVAGVLALDQLPVTAIMTPRPKLVFLNLDDPDEVNWRKIVASGHSRYPVYQANRDQVVGVVTIKALWANTAFGLPSSLRSVMSPPLIVPETMNVIQLIEQFRKTGQHLALVADEFGSILGLATIIDIMEAIAGDLPEKGRRHAPEARKREDGSWLIDATLLIPDFKELLDLDALPHEQEAEYRTAGGFVMTYFGRIPRAGDHFDYAGWRFEVADMDRHRIDKLLVTPLPRPADDQKTTAPNDSACS